MSSLLGVLEASQWVADRASQVRIDEARLEQLAAQWAQTPFEVPGWDNEIHWSGTPEETAGYIMLLDALNFCFWVDPGQPRWQVEHRGKRWNGYKALSVALGRALEEGTPLASASFLAELSDEQMAHILRGEGEIPLLERRGEHARQLGRNLGSSSWLEFIASAQGSAPGLARLIADTFPCFHDVSEYQGRLVPLFKRAQITVVDLAGSFGFAGPGAFHDLHALTAFADYKIPQVLRAWGVLVYAPALADRVDGMEPLVAGCEEEVEIRAGMVWATELLRRALARHGMKLEAYQLDWFLWNVGQSTLPDEKPFHRVRTVFY